MVINRHHLDSIIHKEASPTRFEEPNNVSSDGTELRVDIIEKMQKSMLEEIVLKI
jgi:hypothetical protein